MPSFTDADIAPSPSVITDEDIAHRTVSEDEITGPTPSPTPETDKALAQLPSELSAPPPESAYDPNKYPIAERAAQSVVGYVKGMVPTSVNQALRMANVPTNWQDPEQLTSFLAPALKMPFDTVHQIVSRAKQIQEADKTPPFSQERWDAAVGTGLDVLGTAAMLKGGMRPEAPVARPEGETAPTTPRGVEPAPAATTEATGAIPEQPLTQGGEVTDAQQRSDAQVQAGDVTLGVEARPEGEVPSASSSDNVVGETSGEKPVVEGAPPQEDVAVTQPGGGSEPATAAVSGAETPPAAELPTLPKNKQVTLKAKTIEGEDLEIKMDAQKAERMITRRRNNLQALLDCLGT